jgi:hypothetical protein
MAIRFAAATLAADDLPDRSPLPCRCEAPIGSEVAEFDAVAMHRTDSGIRFACSPDRGSGRQRINEFSKLSSISPGDKVSSSES